MDGDQQFPDQEINAFLEINSNQLKLLDRYKDILSDGADSFAAVFYDYLFRFPATSKLLNGYADNGGNLKELSKKQVGHLISLLTDQNDPNYLDRLKHIGQVHYVRNIDPVWIMGAYRLYQKHLSTIIAQSNHILDTDRSALNDCLSKLLFRDMGMMLEGYWQATNHSIETEKDKVEHLQQQISALLTNIPQVIWSIDVVNNKPLYVSPTAEKISPISMELPIPCLAWTIPDDRPKVETAWAQAMAGETITVESRVHAPGNTQRWFKRTFHPFIGSEGTVIRVDGIMEEITEAKLAHNKLELMATTDDLTGLANRALWHDRINQNIAIAQRETDKQVVLMLLDLNHFKYVNDTLGHAAGDVVLCQVSQRLEEILRTGDTLARLGGDEFAILLPLVDNGESSAINVANKIQTCFNKPYFFGGNELYLGVAIGITIYPQHGDDADTLVRCADMAMYTSKRNNQPYQFYKSGLDKPYSKQIQLVSSIKNGLKQDEFELYYQPKIHLETGQTSGLEALIRWRHPTQGQLSPEHFIPIAEQMGLMKELTEWVIATALKQNQHWGNNGIHTPVAVNVSARSFQDHSFVQSVKNALELSQTSPENLEIEITENTLMSNIDSAINIIKSLSDLGIRIAIDDFGTGYSSLSYLKRLPIDELKIDQSFVRNMDTDKNDAAIVMSVIDLGHNLGFKVVAEGVERKKPMQMLRELGCDTAQGYHISRPMPTAAVASWLAEPGTLTSYV